MSSTPEQKKAAPIIEVKDLWTIFPGADGGEHIVHKNLNLTVRRGEVMTLVGGSGTGKTVLLRQMLGLLQPAKGEIQVMGRPAAELSGPGAATRVGMLFQGGALFSAFSVIDNIAFPLRETGVVPKELVREAALLKLQMVGLKMDDADKMPADLSGGMIKRVALARALIMDPPLLMLDEPTAGLDPNSSDEFVALLESLHHELGFTVVMVTHDLDTLFAMSSEVAVLADKKIIIAAPVRQVLQFDHPFIRHFFWGARGQRAMQALNTTPGANDLPVKEPEPVHTPGG